MSGYENTVWCESCGAEILCRPYLVNENVFCCQDCASGFSCRCSRAMEWEEDFREPTSKVPVYQEK